MLKGQRLRRVFRLYDPACVRHHLAHEVGLASEDRVFAVFLVPQVRKTVLERKLTPQVGPGVTLLVTERSTQWPDQLAGNVVLVHRLDVVVIKDTWRWDVVHGGGPLGHCCARAQSMP